MHTKKHSNKPGYFLGLLGSAALTIACGAGDMAYETEVDADEPMELGLAEQDYSAACGGDDSNALAAALAVAIGNELGRWDVNTDFVVQNGKLALSATGNLHCGSGCANIKALLQLQDDASSTITNHNAATYRNKLTSWYNAQRSKLNNLVQQTMLNVDKGVFRIRSVRSGKYVVPQNGSTSRGAALQQSDRYTGTTAAQWRVVLKGTTHEIRNVKSGLCMGLNTKSGAQQNVVQLSCSDSDVSQDFRFAQVDFDKYAIRTGYLQALDVSGASTANNASIIQYAFGGNKTNQQFIFEPVGSGSHVDLKAYATAVYHLKVSHTGMAIGVESASLSDGTRVVQQPYNANDDRFHWYFTPAVDGTSRYQLINRRTGSCLDMADPNSTGATGMIQRRCSTAESQKLFFTPTGVGAAVMWTHKGYSVDVQNASKSSGARLVQGGKTWESHNMLTLTPVTAGEPHRLEFTRKTNDGPCGSYYWYDVTQPNGVALDNPASTYVQLIFAGGKQSPNGSDLNPFIAQRVSGTQVAIDPTYGLFESGSTTSGSCSNGCLKVSKTNISGQCCSCNGKKKKFSRTPWNAQTYQCK